MILSRFSKLSLLAFSFLPITLHASDFTYQETTQLTGGSMLSMIKMAGAFSSQLRKAGEPVVTSIYLKDNRMAKVSAEGIEIIDLDNETITHIDSQKHSYYTLTFQQIRDQAAAAQDQLAKQGPAPKTSQPAPQTNPDNVKVSFDVKVRKTGATKVVTGLPADEAIMTMMMNATDTTTQQQGAMAITNDMWMVPEIPGYRQVGEFYARMAVKMGVFSPEASAAAALDLSKMLAQHPGATDALTDMAKEMQKLKGVPIMQVMRMGTTTNGQPLPAASEAPLPPPPSTPSGGDIAKQSAASMLASKIPFGFGRKKNDQQADQSQNQSQDQNPNSPPPTSAVLMETQITTSAFSSAPVDPSHFEVPAGYKMTQAPR